MPILNFFQQILTLNGTFDWSYVQGFLFDSSILQGVLITIILSVLAQLFGSLIGLGLYFLRRSRWTPLRVLGNAYVGFFRGTPLLVQLLFLSEFIADIHLARPLIATHIFQNLGFTIQVPVDEFFAALLALALNEGAYMAEIVRAGIDSIDVGQLEAARSLGMTYGMAMRRIVLPQAMRVIIPPLGNEFNSMLKSSSLASVIAVFELLKVAQDRATLTGAVLELLVVAALWYLALTTVWGVIQGIIERRLGASTREPGRPDERRWWQRNFGWARTLPVPIAIPPAGIPSETGVPTVGERR